MSKTKYIFIVGGVISGVGKGITTSSIGLILKSKGYSVTALKIDPYINVDAGTMNPTEHGEVFVLSDGDECDQDMGNYERFLNTSLTRSNYMTTGRVYGAVIENERKMKYKGKTVQVIPHIPEEVIRRIRTAGEKTNSEVVLIEIGGTVGEYENLVFLEALRMMKSSSAEDVMSVMVSYLPMPSTVGEMKTKPTQHAVRQLQSAGVQPDIIIARSSAAMDDKRKEKLSMFCNISKDKIISAPDVERVYDVPINFEKDKISKIIIETLNLKKKKEDNLLKDWKKFFTNPEKEVKIAIVGKYFNTGDFVLSDAYLSVLESLKYAGYSNKVKVKLDWLSSQDFESGKLKLSILKNYKGVLVPGGFGASGVEGKIKVIEYVRKNKIPFLGICYGMQLAVIEYARNVIKLKGANTTEIDQDAIHPIIDIQESQKLNIKNSIYGNTMRLGDYSCEVAPGTNLYKAYKSRSINGKVLNNKSYTIVERHRHRYEVNNDYVDRLKSSGLVISGFNPEANLVEAVELPATVHPFFVGVQYHPEFTSRPIDSHPLFDLFVKTAMEE